MFTIFVKRKAHLLLPQNCDGLNQVNHNFKSFFNYFLFIAYVGILYLDHNFTINILYV